MMFDTAKPFYITKGVQVSILPEIVRGMLDSIMDMKRVVSQVDYLQVFNIDTNGTTTYITHSQEEPDFKKQLILTSSSNQFCGKVYIIDDGTCTTVLLESEY